MKTLNQSMEWQALLKHHEAIADARMQDWFDDDPARFKRFSLQQIINRIFSATRDEQDHIREQIQEAYLLSCKRIISVHIKHRNNHSNDQRNCHKAGTYSED